MAKRVAEEMGLAGREFAPAVVLPAVPPWFMPRPVVDMGLLGGSRKEGVARAQGVEMYVDRKFFGFVQVFTDGAKNPEMGKAAAAIGGTRVWGGVW